MYGEYEEAEKLKAAKEAMMAHLEEMKQSGVALFMDGRAVLPAEIVAKAVRENSPYMADYVINDAGTIQQVWFDRVTKQ